MKTIPNRGDNPGGLSTTDPMRHAGYRETVRAISDRYMSLKGKTTLPHTETAWASLNDKSAVMPQASDEAEQAQALFR